MFLTEQIPNCNLMFFPFFFVQVCMAFCHEYVNYVLKVTGKSFDHFYIGFRSMCQFVSDLYLNTELNIV